MCFTLRIQIKAARRWQITFLAIWYSVCRFLPAYHSYRYFDDILRFCGLCARISQSRRHKSWRTSSTRLKLKLCEYVKYGKIEQGRDAHASNMFTHRKIFRGGTEINDIAYYAGVYTDLQYNDSLCFRASRSNKGLFCFTSPHSGILAHFEHLLSGRGVWAYKMKTT